MERINIRYETLNKALKSLEIPLKKLKKTPDEETYKMIRDSLIKRFEYSYEVFWQFLKQLLEDKYDAKIVGTRDIFRQALKNGLITESELSVLFDMVLDRNETVHTYHEKIAEAITNDIPAYFETMKVISKRLENYKS